MYIHHEESGAGHPIVLGGAGLRAAHVPVLIVNGANDHPYVDTARRLADELPNADVVTIPDADHVSVVTDARFRTTVLDFLERHER